MPGAITTPAMTAPAVVTPAVNGSGGVVGGAAGTATAAPSFVPTVTSTPVALALTATSVPAGPSPTKTPVLGVRTSVAYVATATVWPTPHETTRVDAHSTARATVRADMSATPRAIKPVIVRANNGRPARPASRSIPAVPIASGNTGRSTSGVAAPSPTPMRPAPTVSPTNAARAVILPPLAKLVATPAAGNSSSAVANVTALPGGVATTIGNNVASAPTVVATLIPALPTITAAAPSVIPSVSTALPLPTILVSGTGTVVASDTPAPTIPAALPISIPTVAPTIEDPGTVTATLGAIPTAVSSVPVPPDSSNVTPTAIASGIPSVIAAAPTATAMATGVSGVSTPTETPIVVAAATDIPTTVVTMLPTTAPTTTIATETATATATPSSALLSSQDIGNVGVAGSTLDVAGIYTLMGSGADIGGTADAFHFAYLSLVGDGQIVAHVAAQTDTDPQAKAGVMIRETLDPSARFADMVLTPDRGVAFQQRTEPGVNAAHTELDGVAAPAWVKLARSGSTLTGFVSSDGMTWTPVGTDTVPMSTTVYVGLAVTAHNNALLNTALFDHVVVSAGAKGRRNTYSFQAHSGM